MDLFRYGGVDPKVSDLRVMYYFLIHLTIYSFETAVVYRSPKTIELHDLILSMSDRKYSNKEIADYLNFSGIKPRRTEKWSGKLIWSAVKKLKDRRQRETSSYWEVNDIQIIKVR